LKIIGDWQSATVVGEQHLCGIALAICQQQYSIASLRHTEATRLYHSIGPAISQALKFARD
jgi:hypothetical protein